MNTIASMNLFAISKVAIGIGQHSDLHWPSVVEHSGLDQTWVVAALGRMVQSDSDHLLKRVDFWHLSSGNAIALGGFRNFGSGAPAVTVSVWLHVCSSGTDLVHNDLSRQDWPKSKTSSL